LSLVHLSLVHLSLVHLSLVHLSLVHLSLVHLSLAHLGMIQTKAVFRITEYSFFYCGASMQSMLCFLPA
jgi:hypothetical protein